MVQWKRGSELHFRSLAQIFSKNKYLDRYNAGHSIFSMLSRRVRWHEPSSMECTLSTNIFDKHYIYPLFRLKGITCEWKYFRVRARKAMLPSRSTFVNEVQVWSPWAQRDHSELILSLAIIFLLIFHSVFSLRIEAVKMFYGRFWQSENIHHRIPHIEICHMLHPIISKARATHRMRKTSSYDSEDVARPINQSKWYWKFLLALIVTVDGCLANWFGIPFSLRVCVTDSLRWLKCKNWHVLSETWIENLHKNSFAKQIERSIVAILGSICDFFALPNWCTHEQTTKGCCLNELPLLRLCD